MKPQKYYCHGYTRDVQGCKRECCNTPVPVIVHGDFGDQRQYLCSECIARYQGMGWRITYQLGGSEANAAATKGR